MSNEIDVSDIAPTELLAALYNASKPLGLGALHFDPTLMTSEEAAEFLAFPPNPASGGHYFDYLKGRVMKVLIGKPVLNVARYDRDNGEGAAAAVVAKLRGSHD